MSFEWKTKPVSKKEREINCAYCHSISGLGGNIGPDLSGIGERRSINFLQAFTTDPKSVLPGATMPTYRDVLTPEQVRHIAAYLSSLRGEVPSPTPLPIETLTSEKVSPTAPVPVAPPQIPHSLGGSPGLFGLPPGRSWGGTGNPGRA